MRKTNKIINLINVFVILILFNSCTNESSSIEQTEAKNIFKEALFTSKRKLEDLKVSKKSKTTKTNDYSKQNEEIVEFSLTKLYPENNYVIDDFSYAARLISDGELIWDESNVVCGDLNTICLEVNENQIKQSLTPTATTSKQFLYNYNFTDAELQAELGDNIETGAIIMSMIIMEIENNIQNGNYSTLASKGDVLSCFAVAIGVAGIFDLIDNTRSLASFGEAATRKEMLRLVGKLGRRFLGWIGVAILIKDFGDFMEYW